MLRGRRRSGGSRGFRPSRTWLYLGTAWSQAVTVDTAVSLISLEAPTGLALTSDPPEDLTVLRLVGDISCSLSGPADWNLALTVQDTTWTPSGTFGPDADKRILWSRTYSNTTAGLIEWVSPGMTLAAGVVVASAPRDAVHVDIAPKVKLAPGKALYLVMYEETGAATFTTSSVNMRLLFQRSGRR